MPIDIDDPKVTIKRKKILLNKYFLKRIYIDFYTRLLKEIDPKNLNGNIIEIGSGGGFIKKIIPNAKTSDILRIPDLDFLINAKKLPFKKNSLNVILMIDVFHHINNINLFLTEADRVLKSGGQIIMIEPSSNLFSRFVYKYFHHEQHNINGGWTFNGDGPLSDANSALPWIVFVRDRKIFINKYKDLVSLDIKTHTPFRYILSGGFTTKQIFPDFMYNLILTIENIIAPFNRYVGLFYTINIKKM